MEPTETIGVEADDWADRGQDEQKAGAQYSLRHQRQPSLKMVENQNTRQRSGAKKPRDDADVAVEEEESIVKPKRPRELTIDEVELETAMLVGINEVQPEEEEAELLPPGTNLHQYIKVRNHVLTKWRADVNRYLTLEDAGQLIKRQHLPLVELSWNYLTRYGWINWGVAPALMKDPLASSTGKPSVVIVGAGLAGAAAARQLTKWGWRVVVLEGRNRPGGRVWSMPLEGSGHAGAADLGGAIITGINGNPLAVLAQQLGLPLHNIRDTCPMYLANGQLAPKDLDDQVHAQHNALLDAAHVFREELPTEVADCLSVGAAMRMLWEEVPREPGCEELQEQLMQWHFRNVEFANAARLHTLSLRGWDQDDPHEMLGPHVMLPGGNVRLVEALLKDVPVMYNAVVQHIQHGSKGVTVTTADMSLSADAVLVTAPLGVLKKNSITFSPPLPRAKQSAIQRLGFGVLNKLVMLFPHAFWGSELDLLAHVATDPVDSGLFYLFYAYQPQLAGRGAVLAALVSGEAAERFESMSIQDVVSRVMQVLRNMHQPRGIAVPEPLQAVATRWANDPLAWGSYSSVAVGATGDDYDTMAQDVGGRLFFAGEATISKWPATMHGAFLSGLREAGKIVSAFETPKKRRRGVDAVVGRDDSDEPDLSEDDTTDHSSDDDGASKQSRPQASKRKPLALSSAALQAVSGLINGGVTLRRLFNEAEPDIEFGCFSAFNGPEGTTWHQKALLQVEVRGMRMGPKKSVHLYGVVTFEQLSRIRNATGGDEGRMAALVSALGGTQLLGRSSTSLTATQMAVAIISSRKLDHLLQDDSVHNLAGNGDHTAANAGASTAITPTTNTQPANNPPTQSNARPVAPSPPLTPPPAIPLTLPQPQPIRRLSPQPGSIVVPPAIAMLPRPALPSLNGASQQQPMTSTSQSPVTQQAPLTNNLQGTSSSSIQPRSVTSSEAAVTTTTTSQPASAVQPATTPSEPPSSTPAASTRPSLYGVPSNVIPGITPTNASQPSLLDSLASSKLGPQS